MTGKPRDELPAEERCEPRVQIAREDEKAELKPRRKPSQHQGIRKDQRGQEQPADKQRAQKNR